MIYLSWSVAQIAMHLIVLAMAYAFFMIRNKSKKATVSKVFAGLIFVTAYMAFDVGTRQQDLQRGSFNAEHPSSVEKVQRETMGRADASKSINKSLEASK